MRSLMRTEAAEAWRVLCVACVLRPWLEQNERGGRGREEMPVARVGENGEGGLREYAV